MNKILVLFISLVFNLACHSQNFTVSNLRQGTTVYIGINNTISCTVEGVPSKAVLLATDNGSIVKQSHIYIYRPSKTADQKIVVYKKINNKLRKVGEFFVRVRNIPDPIAIIGGISEGYISKGLLSAQGGIGAQSPPFLAVDIDYTVKNFAMMIMRSGEIIFHNSYYSNIFTPDIHDAFKLLQKEDRIVFSSITVQLPDEKKVSVKPIEFIISN
jgi:hypothetical protein